MITKTFIKEARRQLNLTQKELADLINTAPHNIANYERGLCRVPGDLVLAIQDLLNNNVNITHKTCQK